MTAPLRTPAAPPALDDDSFGESQRGDEMPVLVDSREHRLEELLLAVRDAIGLRADEAAQLLDGEDLTVTLGAVEVRAIYAACAKAETRLADEYRVVVFDGSTGATLADVRRLSFGAARCRAYALHRKHGGEVVRVQLRGFDVGLVVDGEWRPVAKAVRT